MPIIPSVLLTFPGRISGVRSHLRRESGEGRARHHYDEHHARHVRPTLPIHGLLLACPPGLPLLPHQLIDLMVQQYREIFARLCCDYSTTVLSTSSPPLKYVNAFPLHHFARAVQGTRSKAQDGMHNEVTASPTSSSTDLFHNLHPASE